MCVCVGESGREGVLPVFRMGSGRGTLMVMLLFGNIRLQFSPIRQEGQEKIHTKQTVAQSLNYRWPKNTIYAESAESPFLEAPGVLPALTTRDNGVGISSLVGASPSNTARARCKAEFEPNRVEQENVAQETLTAFPTYPTAIIIVWVFMLVMVGLGSCEFVCLFFFFIYL